MQYDNAASGVIKNWPDSAGSPSASNFAERDKIDLWRKNSRYSYYYYTVEWNPEYRDYSFFKKMKTYTFQLSWAKRQYGYTKFIGPEEQGDFIKESDWDNNVYNSRDSSFTNCSYYSIYSKSNSNTYIGDRGRGGLYIDLNNCVFNIYFDISTSPCASYITENSNDMSWGYALKGSVLRSFNIYW